MCICIVHDYYIINWKKPLLRASQRLAFEYRNRPKICKLKQISMKRSWVQNSSSIPMGYLGVWDSRHLSVSAVIIIYHWAWFNKKLSKENWRTSQALDYLFNLKDKIESLLWAVQYVLNIWPVFAPHVFSIHFPGSSATDKLKHTPIIFFFIWRKCIIFFYQVFIFVYLVG